MLQGFWISDREFFRWEMKNLIVFEFSLSVTFMLTEIQVVLSIRIELYTEKVFLKASKTCARYKIIKFL